MRPMLLAKTLFRSPIKTLVTFILLIVISFGLLSRVYEHSVTSREFKKIEETFYGIGTVEASPPERISADTAIFLRGNYYNPSHPDGTWEETRYEGLSEAVMSTIKTLPYIASVDTRYMTAGISDTYFRLDDRKTHFNYANQIVFEATLDTWDSFYHADWDAVPYGLRETFANFINVKPLSHVNEFTPDFSEGLNVAITSNYRGDYPDWLDPEIIKENESNAVNHATSIPQRCSNEYIFNDVSHAIIDDFTQGARYVLSAHFDPLSHDGDFINLGSPSANYWLDLIIPVPDDDPDYLQTEAFADWRHLIEMTNADMHTFDVVYTGDMSAIPRFGNGYTRITEGRMLSPADADANVAVISNVLAETYGLSVGDKISLGLADELHEQHVGLGAVASGARGRYAKPVKDVTLEIIGLYTELTSEVSLGNDPHFSYSSSTIFVPAALLPDSVDLTVHVVKPGEFSFVIPNARDIRPFLEQYESFIKEELGLRLTIHDRGWSEVEQDFLLRERIAIMAISVLCLAMIAAIALVVYLFIIQRKKEYAIMRATGCDKARANKAIFLPLLMIGIPAVVIGSGGAWLYTTRSMAETLFENVTALQETTFDISIPWYIVAICVIGLLAFLCASGALGLAIIGRLPPLVLLQSNAQTDRRKKLAAITGDVDTAMEIQAFQLSQIIPVPAEKTYKSFSHVASYVFRSIKRQKIKSYSTVIIAAALFTTLGQFVAVWQATHATYETTPVEVIFHDRLSPFWASKIEETGLVKDPYYEFYGGVADELDRVPSILLPDETGPRGQLAVTNDIERFYGEALEIEYVPGYDIKQMMDSSELVCVMVGSTMDSILRVGVSLGDEIAITRLTGEESPPTITCVYKIIGRIETTDRSIDGFIFLPPGASHLALFAQENPPERNTYYDLVVYTLADNYQANELRVQIETLNGGTLQYLMDTDTLDKIENNLRLFQALFPIIALVLGIIGGLLPGLMILQSAKVAALLRIVGTTKGRVRAMLAGQQLCLCTVGLGLGVLIVLLFNGWESIMGWLDMLGLCIIICGVFYVIGSAICVVMVTSSKALALLQIKE